MVDFFFFFFCFKKQKTNSNYQRNLLCVKIESIIINDIYVFWFFENKNKNIIEYILNYFWDIFFILLFLKINK